jgi:hypothetical protein
MPESWDTQSVIVVSVVAASISGFLVWLVKPRSPSQGSTSPFSGWLLSQDPKRDTKLFELQEFAKKEGANWPSWSDNISEYLKVVDDKSPALVGPLQSYYVNWVRTGGPSSRLGALLPHAGTIGLGVVALCFLIGIAWGLSSSDFYSSLALTEQGRGLITFLFALTATAIILMHSIAIFSFKDSKDLEGRIGPAKDVLTVVIGVLGTIIGFYFGSSVDSRMNISNISINPSVLTKTTPKVDLHARINGGVGPFQYTIHYGDTSVSDVSQVSHIRKELNISKEISQPDVKSLNITLAVTDSRGNQAHSTAIFPVELGSSAGSTPTPSGSKTTTPGGGKLALDAIEVNPTPASRGKPVTIKAKISGGTAPYTFVIRRVAEAGKVIDLVAAKQSLGEISEQPSIPDDIKAGKMVIVLDVTDEKGAKGEKRIDLEVQE